MRPQRLDPLPFGHAQAVSSNSPSMRTVTRPSPSGSLRFTTVPSQRYGMRRSPLIGSWSILYLSGRTVCLV